MNSHSNSASSLHAMNAQVVLDQTRRELREYLMGEPVESTKNYAGSATKDERAGASRNTRQRRASGLNGNVKGIERGNVNGIDWMGLVKAGAATWWRDHPLHVGATVLKPVVTDYVKRKPIATLALAAAAGAAFVLIRPWRIASVTALGMSLVRSSNLPVMAASLVATVAENLQKEQS